MFVPICVWVIFLQNERKIHEKSRFYTNMFCVCEYLLRYLIAYGCTRGGQQKLLVLIRIIKHRDDMSIISGGYHGNTATIMSISSVFL